MTTSAKISIITPQLSLLHNNEICAAVVFHIVPLCHIITLYTLRPLGLFNLLYFHLQKKRDLPLESGLLLEHL